MNGLPSDTDLRFLSGMTLSQVCIGLHEVNLSLHPEDVFKNPYARIMTEASVRICRNGEDWSTLGEAAYIGIALVPLLGNTIEGTSIISPGTLRINWSSGVQVELIDESEYYESYSITHGDEIIVV